MSLHRSIAHNTIIQFTSKILAIAFGVLTVGLMTRYLGKVGFGQYSTITAFLQFFAILVDFGLQLSMVNLISDPRHNPAIIYNNTLTLRIISALALFVIAPLIALFFPFDQAVKTGMWVLTLNYLALAINQILIGFFQKELRMDKVAISETIGRVFLLAGVALMIFLNAGLYAILAAIVISSVIQVALLFGFAQKFTRFEWAADFTIWSLIIRHSWPIAISIAFNLIYFKADTIILSLTRTQAEVGIYSAPYRMLEILSSFPYLFVGLILPILASAWNVDDRQRYALYFQKAFDALVAVAIPIIVGTLPLAGKIMIMIAGQQFAESGIVLQIIIFATGIIFINALFGYSIVVLNKQRQLIWAYIFTAFLSLVLYLIYIPRYSYIAASYITILAELLMLIFNVYVSIKTSGYWPKLGMIVRSLIASLGMFIIIELLKSEAVLIIIPIAAAAYFILLYTLGGIKKQTIQEIMALRS